MNGESATEDTGKDVSLSGIRLPNSVRKQLKKTNKTLKKTKRDSSEILGGGKRKRNKTIHKIGLRGIINKKDGSSSNARDTEDHEALKKAKEELKLKTKMSERRERELLREKIRNERQKEREDKYQEKLREKDKIKKEYELREKLHNTIHSNQGGSGKVSTDNKRHRKRSILKNTKEEMIRSKNKTIRKSVRFIDEEGGILSTPFPVPRRMRFTQKRKRYYDDGGDSDSSSDRQRNSSTVLSSNITEIPLELVFTDDEPDPIDFESLDTDDTTVIQSNLRKKGVYVQSDSPIQLLKHLNLITADIPDNGIQHKG